MKKDQIVLKFSLIFIVLAIFKALFDINEIGVGKPYFIVFYFIIKYFILFSLILLNRINFKIFDLLKILIFTVFVSLPYLLIKPILFFDNDNLVVKSGALIICFFLLQKNLSEKYEYSLYSIILVGLIPILNFSLANNFIQNFSIFWPLFKFNLNPIKCNNYFFDFCLLLVESFFYLMLSYQKSSFEFLTKSGYFFFFMVLKTLIYWSIASIGLAIFGNYGFGFYSNKFEVLLSFLAFSILLVYSSRVFKVLFENRFLNVSGEHLFLFLPFVDFLFLGLILFRKSKISLKLAIIIMISSLIIYLGYHYFFVVQILPKEAMMYKNFVLIYNFILPVMVCVILAFKFSKELIFSVLISFILLIFAFIYIPEILNTNNFISLSLAIQLALHALYFMCLLKYCNISKVLSDK